MWAPGVLCALSGCFSSTSSSFLTCLCWTILSWRLKGSLCWSLESCVGSSPLWCPAMWTPAAVASLKSQLCRFYGCDCETPGAYLGSPSLFRSLDTLQARGWGIHRLTSLVSQGLLSCPAWDPVAANPCFKCHFWIFHCFRKGCKSNSCYFLWRVCEWWGTCLVLQNFSFLIIFFSGW